MKALPKNIILLLLATGLTVGMCYFANGFKLPRRELIVDVSGTLMVFIAIKLFAFKKAKEEGARKKIGANKLSAPALQHKQKLSGIITIIRWQVSAVILVIHISVYIFFHTVVTTA